MSGLIEFKRSNAKLPCCEVFEDHWQFTADKSSECCCGQKFVSHKNIDYAYCSNKMKMYLLTVHRSPNIWMSSTHSDCILELMIKHRLEVIIGEICELYGKLRLIESDLTTDVIRYITLSELLSAKI